MSLVTFRPTATKCDSRCAMAAMTNLLEVCLWSVGGRRLGTVELNDQASVKDGWLGWDGRRSGLEKDEQKP